MVKESRWVRFRCRRRQEGSLSASHPSLCRRMTKSGRSACWMLSMGSKGELVRPGLGAWLFLPSVRPLPPALPSALLFLHKLLWRSK